MTAPGRYAADDGSFAKSTGGAAARGGVLIAVAVALGLIILAVAYDGGDDTAAGSGDDTTADDTTDDTAADDTTDDTTDTTPADDDTAADDTSGDDDTATTTPPPLTTRPPGEVKVVVANAVGEPGLAGAGVATLTTAGYVGAPKNAVNRETPASVIYYIEGYSEDAKAVASAFAAPAELISAAPADVLALIESPDDVSDFHIFLIQGQDRALG